jgi:hypothetical protein
MAAKPPQIFFFFLSGAKKGKIEFADAQVVRIGRQPYCELQLDPYQDIPASGDHCHVIREADGYYVLDSGSTFGTFINGMPVQGRVKLNTGDVIECGKDPAQGREGPRLKFYLETDVRKCPICSGPVYKRHFKCPDCGKKTCLRCIDFKTKICKHCADAREAAALANATAAKRAPAPKQKESAGFEVVEDDDVKAKRPQKVVLSGKEAAKVKAHRKAKELGAAESESGPIEAGNLSAPFCDICKDFAKGSPFVCPACGRELCASHRVGRVCQPCSGAGSDPVVMPVEKKTRVLGAAPLKPAVASPDSDDLVAELVEPAPVPAPTPAASPSSSAWGKSGNRAPDTTSTPRSPQTPPHGAPLPGTIRGRLMPDPMARPGPAPHRLSPSTDERAPLPPNALPPPGTTRFAPGAMPRTNDGEDGTPQRGSPSPGAPVRPGPPPSAKPTTGTARCARCRGPLGPGTFCCRACRRILCFAHVAVDDVCEDCYLQGRDRSAGAAPARAAAPAADHPRASAPFFPSQLQPEPAAPVPNTPADRGRSRRALDDTALDAPPPAQGRPSDFHTVAIPESELSSQLPEHVPDAFDAAQGPTIAEIEALDMMPLLDTEKDEDALRASAEHDGDDLARPPPGSSSEDGLSGLSFVCPHCDAPLPASARACPRCRKAL